MNQTGSSDNKYQYAGEQFDSTLGDYYLRQRFYDFETGRFIRQDAHEGTLRKPITLNKYAYADSNPVTLTDPSGYFSILEVAAQNAVFSALVGATVSGGLTASVGLASGNLDMKEVLIASAKGALGGAIFGFTAGLAGPALAGLGIAGRTAGTLTGVISATVSNTGIQALDLATGGQSEFSIESLIFSAALGGVAGCILFRPTDSMQQQVSHWSNEAPRAFQEGERYWVMTSGSYRSYGLAGISKRYPYSNRTVTVVPASKLSYPEKLEAFKGIYGQRMYKP